MLRRKVKNRPYVWEPLVAPVLMAYQLSVSKSKNITPRQLIFSRKMCVPIDFGNPLADPPRDFLILAKKIPNNQEWFYQIATKTINFSHIRAETCYNVRAVEKLYNP